MADDPRWLKIVAGWQEAVLPGAPCRNGTLTRPDDLVNAFPEQAAARAGEPT